MITNTIITFGSLEYTPKGCQKIRGSDGSNYYVKKEKCDEFGLTGKVGQSLSIAYTTESFKAKDGKVIEMRWIVGLNGSASSQPQPHPKPKLQQQQQLPINNVGAEKSRYSPTDLKAFETKDRMTCTLNAQNNATVMVKCYAEMLIASGEAAKLISREMKLFLESYRKECLTQIIKENMAVFGDPLATKKEEIEF